jgi:hypothetical protein
LTLPNRPEGVYTGDVDIDTGLPDGVGSFVPSSIDFPSYFGEWSRGLATTRVDVCGEKLTYRAGHHIESYSGGFVNDLPHGGGVIKVKFLNC